MIYFFDNVAAIGICHKQIGTRQLGNAERKHKRNVKAAPSKGCRIKAVYHINAEVAKHKRHQHFGDRVCQIGTSLILLRRLTEVKGIIRPFSVTG